MSLEARVRVVLSTFDEDIHLTVGEGEVVAVLGPNGSGKSTLLRALAGVQPLSAGRISLDGTVFDDPALGILVPPEHRPCALVYQEHLLFRHLSVLDNVAFGPRCRGATKAEAVERARGWLDRLDLTDLAAARPATLSGGQSQRVAVARALATEPRLLLLDEPTAALDAAQRGTVRAALRSRLRSFGGSCVLVTHDLLDAVAMADRLLVIESGRTVQSGTFAELARRPRTSFVAELMGRNLLRGRAVGRVLPLDGGPVLDTTSDGPRCAAISPSDIVLSPDRPTDASVVAWATMIQEVDLLGHQARIRFGPGDGMTALVPMVALANQALTEGASAWASVDPARVDVFDPAGD
jgi:molybdate transport system ATP-binding protein